MNIQEIKSMKSRSKNKILKDNAAICKDCVIKRFMTIYECTAEVAEYLMMTAMVYSPVLSEVIEQIDYLDEEGGLILNWEGTEEE